MEFGMNVNGYAFSASVLLLSLTACGSSKDPSDVNGAGSSTGVPGAGSTGSGTPGGNVGGAGPNLQIPGDSGGSPSGSQGATCDATGKCTCSGSNTTTIEGYVFD